MKLTVPKYVVSRTLRGADADWTNSTVLSRDLVGEVTKPLTQAYVHLESSRRSRR